MNGKMRFDKSEVEQMAREILSHQPLRSESPDAVFLAEFRRKLAGFKKAPESTILSVARLSWNLAPATALASLLLCVGLILKPAHVSPGEEAWERVLTEIADDQTTEVSRDLLVEAVLLGPGR